MEFCEEITQAVLEPTTTASGFKSKAAKRKQKDRERKRLSRQMMGEYFHYSKNYSALRRAAQNLCIRKIQRGAALNRFYFL